MSQIELRYLHNVEFKTIHQTFLLAFSDYLVPFNLSEEQFGEMMTRRGADFELSVGAFSDGKLVGFNINAFGDYGDTFTVYDVVTGIVPDHRRKGISRALFDFSLPRLRETKASRYLLEAISTNLPAISAYQSIGFHPIRTLQAFRRSSTIQPRKKLPAEARFVVLNQIDRQAAQSFWSWQPSWQNSSASIERSRAAKIILGALFNDELIGYGIVYLSTGDIPQFALSPAKRRTGIGSHLINELQKMSTAGAVRIINVDTSDSATMAFLDGIGTERLLSQQEMELKF